MGSFLSTEVNTILGCAGLTVRDIPPNSNISQINSCILVIETWSDVATFQMLIEQNGAKQASHTDLIYSTN